MLEIIIPHPEMNRLNIEYRRYAYADGVGRGFSSSVIRSTLDMGVNPQEYPLAAELCAGDGSWARMLVDHGWDAKNITCIDIAKTTTPLVDGVRWLYWDLNMLGARLDQGLDLPSQVEALRGKFDIVLLMYDASSIQKKELVCDFFTREQGLICTGEDLRFK